MILFWILAILLGANMVVNDLLITGPLQLLHGLSTGLNLVFIVAAIALGSWFIGED